MYTKTNVMASLTVKQERIPYTPNSCESIRATGIIQINLASHISKIILNFFSIACKYLILAVISACKGT